MKQVSIVCLFLLLSIPALDAQNLAFSDVLNLAGNCPGGSHDIDTVPAGKVWKLQNVATSNVSIGLEIPGQAVVSISVTNDIFPITYTATGSTYTTLMNPFWLAEGTIIKAFCGASVNYDYVLSVIEFTK